MASPTAPTMKLLLPPGPSTKSIHVTSDSRIEDPSVSGLDTGFQRPSTIFYDALKVRIDVFKIEQKCDPAMEVDAEDAISWHWVIYAENGEKQEVPAATIRLVPAQAHADADDEKAVHGPNYTSSLLWDHKEPYVKFGRLAALKEFRGRKFGNMLVEAASKYAEQNSKSMVEDQELGEWKGQVLIHAQRWLERWYGSMGFQTDKGMGTWLEEGIEHVGMWKRLNVS